jgi:hypothetical protein
MSPWTHIRTPLNGRPSLVGVLNIIGVVVSIIAYHSPLLPDVPNAGLLEM